MVLVITLFGLAVVSLLLLAVFAGASQQVTSAQTDALLAREKILADSAVALVIGQIATASAPTNLAWISQPGLLRTYAATATRAPVACYKLYSTPTLAGMIDTSGTVQFLTNDIPAQWTNSPSQYVDLNAPAPTPGASGASIYPILDPAVLTNATNAAAGTQIEGVSSDNANGIGTNAVTMPVAWLYQLQDGTLGTTTNATAQNPIVARVAFWTDDNTCKVNINTAGDGCPWNVPRFNSTNDVFWSTNQPAQGECSAYPGHPATTSLTAVFGTNWTPQQLLALSPRYAWGGTEFDTQSTTNNEVVLPKVDRFYASADELAFSTNVDGSGNRETNFITPKQVQRAGFVLTADSVAPETTLLGAPRIAIWPIADSTTTNAPRITAADAAISNAATVGEGTTNIRSYFFQRNNPQNQLDDFDPASTNAAAAGNVALFDELLARGSVSLPGYGAAFLSKYPDPEWTQLMLELVDFVHALNAVDPSPSPFVPFAPGDSTGAGRAFVEPLTWNYTSGTNSITLRGLGRCPTLSSLTLVFYVSGFNFRNGTHIDYEESPDIGGTNWTANFLPTSTNWTNVIGERVRAFVVPNTSQPGCGYPEVSDACKIQINGLNGLVATNLPPNWTNLGFASSITSRVLSDAGQVTPAIRAWGGNEGPLAWRAASIDAQQPGLFTNTFRGTNAFSVTFSTNPVPSAGSLTWPTFKSPTFSFGAASVTVSIQDKTGNTLQTSQLAFPNPGTYPPLPLWEYTRDGSNNSVQPSYYMTLKNRVLLTGTNREFIIQPGDTTRTIEAGTDLRVIAGLSNVPSSLFAANSLYKTAALTNVNFLHFEDGTSAIGAMGTNTLIAGANYPLSSQTVTWTNWSTGAVTNYTLWTSPRAACPTLGTTTASAIMGTGTNGDWDTGPGLAPDGAEIDLPDAGTTNAPSAAYFSLSGGAPGAPTQRTPNALVPSPLIFGSLPAGINPATPANSVPWRTLLFCPYPACNNTSTPYSVHPGAASPPDHLILDNFWMPVVEPYAISTCMATAGKINLNDQIAPFIYLHRNTALHALLTSLRIPAVPTTLAGTYKTPGTPSNSVFWNSVDENATIAQIENRFANGSADAYLSESEICTVPLVPQGQAGATVAATQTNLETFWNGTACLGGLTGKNLRELPYAQLYGRLTTRSNSYTVHVRAQILQKLPGDPQQNVWKEGTDLVLGEWRGSYEIERYLDPNAPAPAPGSPLKYYKYRILSCRRFSP